MAWRTVVISNPARLRVEHNQLVIVQEDETPLPLEDIGVLILESPEVTLNAVVLARFAQTGGLLLACDDHHLPCFAGLPFGGHSRLAGVQQMHIGLSLPFKKRCWQAIVRQKIANQAECLRLTGRHECAELASLVHKVASGDSANVESRAARDYFIALFGAEFTRGDPGAVNAALNYGYAVVRASVARAIASFGFLLSQGIHHHSELNPFNLADDFIEPLRPVVDLCVAQTIRNDAEFTQQHRRMLVSLLAMDVVIDGKRQGLSRAAEIMASSFVTACREKSVIALKLPKLIELTPHAYE